jgi:ATP-binding cassette subfamily B protein
MGMPNEDRSSVSAFAQVKTYAGDLRWGLRLAFDAAPRLICIWAVLLVIQGLLTPALIVASREAVNRLAHPGAPGMRITELLLDAAVPLGAVALVLLLTQLCAGVAGWLRTAISEWLRDFVQLRIQEKAAALDLAFFESPDSYDLLHRARIDASSVPAQLIEHVGALLQNGLALIAIAVLLSMYTPWLPVLLIASAAPALWVVGKYALAANRWRLANTTNERRARYHEYVLTQRETAAEIRAFDLGGYFRDTFRTLRDELRQGRLKLESAELRAELWASTAGWLGLIGGMLWIVSRVAIGTARLGDVVMCYQGFQQGQRLLRTLLDSAGSIYRGLLFLENLRTFLDLQSQLKESATPQPLPAVLQQAVRFEHVSFSYPGSDRKALDDVSIELRSGRIIAIVGNNGAGKSTLVKILCRFFDVTEGRLTLDGIDVRDAAIAELRRRITVLFQEPLRHHASVAENIALGDLAADPPDERIRRCAKAAGADEPIRRLPQGYETVLGKWFGGAELSTGEWQRIALARAFLRSASIVVLDEPTSAMDAWAEADWLSRFRSLVSGQTALIITHRFTTAMMADYIYVMQQGRVIESGTHASLVRMNGHYCSAWREQMKFPNQEHSLASAQ